MEKYMKFIDFIRTYQDAPFIDSSTFLKQGKAEDLRRQVRDWVKKGWLLLLKKGLYIFSKEYRKINVLPEFIANFLITPSYLSLEYAMSFYELIPERVTVFTSVTSKKTSRFNNCLGSFQYQTIKQAAFRGYVQQESGNWKITIASAEKSLLDFFYLNPYIKNGSEGEFDSLRLQNLDELNIAVIESYYGVYNKRMDRVIKGLIKYVKAY
jgi:predicted transcriptional regulator of viral defense system